MSSARAPALCKYWARTPRRDKRNVKLGIKKTKSFWENVSCRIHFIWLALKPFSKPRARKTNSLPSTQRLPTFSLVQQFTVGDVWKNNRKPQTAASTNPKKTDAAAELQFCQKRRRCKQHILIQIGRSHIHANGSRQSRVKSHGAAMHQTYSSSPAKHQIGRNAREGPRIPLQGSETSLLPVGRPILDPVVLF